MAAVTATAQDGQAGGGAAPTNVTTPPDRVITPGSPFGTTVLAKPGSSLLYVTESRTAINIWALLTTYWPEIVTIAVTLTAVVLLWRLLRRRRVPGQPHCRKCNYQLTALAAAERCPECGVLFAKRKPVIGRDTRAWIVLTALIAALMPAAYLVCLRACPRVGPWSLWQQWWSCGLYEFAMSRQLAWLSDHGRVATYLEEVDAADGQVKRVVDVNEGWAIGHGLTAVGTKLVGFQQGRMASPMFDLIEIETATGRTHRTPVPLDTMHGLTLAAYCIPTHTAYFLSIEDESLYIINAADGNLRKLADIDFHKKFTNQPSPAAGPIGQSFSFEPPMTCGVPPNDQRFIVTEVDGSKKIRQSGRTTRHANTHKVMLFDGLRGVQEAVLGERVALGGLVASPDGRMLFAAVGGQGIVAWDLEQPDRDPIIVSDDDLAKSLEHLEISPNGRMLSGTSWSYGSGQTTTSLHVYDLSRREWIENLSVPPGWIAHTCFFTGDSRHLISSAGARGAAGGQQIHIYDLAACAPDPSADATPPTFADLAGANEPTPTASERTPGLSLGRASVSDLLLALSQAGSSDAVVEEVIARIGSDELSEAHYAAMFDLCARGDAAALPLSDAWKTRYGRIIKEATDSAMSFGPEGTARLGKAKEKLYAIPLEVLISVRDTWPVDIPAVLQARMNDWWPWPTGHRVLATPRLPGAKGVWISGPAGAIKLPPLEAGEHEVTIDLRIDQLRQSEPGADWQEIERRTMTVPVRVAGAIEKILTPAQSTEIDDALRSGLKYAVGKGWVNVDRTVTERPLFEGIAIGVIMDFFLNGQVVATEYHWWMGGADPPPADREWGPCQRSPWKPLPGERWAIRVRGDPGIALRVPEAKKYWAGDITISLDSE